MVARNGDAEHGGGTGATGLEERVRRLEKDVEELRKQVRTHARTQGLASAETQDEAREETPTQTPGEAPTHTSERRARREIFPSPFAEATRNPVRRRGGDARERGPLFGLFPDGLPPAAWSLALRSLPSGCVPEPPVPRTRNCSWAAVSWHSTSRPSERGACGTSCPTRRHLPSACSPPRSPSWRRCV